MKLAKMSLLSLILSTSLLLPFPMTAKVTGPDKQRILDIIPKMEDFIQAGMGVSKVPGAAVAIVFGDEIMFVKGFGVREQGLPEQVDATTLFQLASLSKPITSSILAAVVGRGEVDWKTKICDLDAPFRLSDAWVTSQLTIEDLLAHRSGLPDHAGDLLEDLKFPAKEIFYRLRFIAPLHAFRSSYAYTNFGFSEAALAVAKKLNMPWNMLAKTRLFHRLDMFSTTFSFEEYRNTKNKAVAHHIKEGIAKALYTRNADSQAPAGGASSNAQDMAKWLRTILADGKYLGVEVIDAKALNASQAPLITTGIDVETKAPIFYGMGWVIKWDNQGRKILSHSGGFALGVRSYAMLIPQDKLGIVLLTNSAWQGLPEAVAEHFYNIVYDVVSQGNRLAIWNERLVQVFAEEKHYAKRASFPSLVLKDYIGQYENDYYGHMEIIENNGQLELHMGPKNMSFTLQHCSRDTFIFTTTGENSMGEAQVIFSFDADGKVHTVTIDYLNAHGNGVFKPVKEALP